MPVKTLRKLALILLLGASGCSSGTDPVTDPCVVRTGNPENPKYHINVEILASADSVPVIDWTPATCGVADVAVLVIKPGTIISVPGPEPLCLATLWDPWCDGSGSIGL